MQLHSYFIGSKLFKVNGESGFNQNCYLFGRNGIVLEEQHSFTRGKSTSIALVSLIEESLRIESVMELFLGLNKAFN